jgi:hypothetical protein
MVQSYLKAAHAVQKRLDVFMWDADQLRSQSKYPADCRRVREIRSSPVSIAAIRMDTVSFASRDKGREALAAAEIQ